MNDPNDRFILKSNGDYLVSDKGEEIRPDPVLFFVNFRSPFTDKWASSSSSRRMDFYMGVRAPRDISVRGVNWRVTSGIVSEESSKGEIRVPKDTLLVMKFSGPAKGKPEWFIPHEKDQNLLRAEHKPEYHYHSVFAREFVNSCGTYDRRIHNVVSKWDDQLQAEMHITDYNRIRGGGAFVQGRLATEGSAPSILGGRMEQGKYDWIRQP